ncbi:hypothetical protein DES49_0029 [Halospina denitrificans]|uniref:Signal transducing protein n=1 Tax=Halospina denitrificans TaxID=332522 RepID=A0A4R7JZF8_9GAMM|nr:DUF6164 family protein [Halospina denitrificans]TDT43930.1 hypothetical protein DES49_0029 [Halospina denitrificans]
MARLLLNLRNVPEDEHLEVRELLDSHDIAYYETEPSPWMISFGAIWLQDEDREDEALSLLADYQEQRQSRERARYEAEGPYPQSPLRLLVAVVAIGVVLYLALMPFLSL